MLSYVSVEQQTLRQQQRLTVSKYTYAEVSIPRMAASINAISFKSVWDPTVQIISWLVAISLAHFSPPPQGI